MSIHVIYQCDRCRHRQSTSEQMWEIGVQLRPLHSTYNVWTHAGKEELWCRKCVDGVGLLMLSPTPRCPQTEPSLEEKLREVLERIGVQMKEGAGE